MMATGLGLMAMSLVYTPVVNRIKATYTTAMAIRHGDVSTQSLYTGTVRHVSTHITMVSCSTNRRSVGVVLFGSENMIQSFLRSCMISLFLQLNVWYRVGVSFCGLSVVNWYLSVTCVWHSMCVGFCDYAHTCTRMSQSRFCYCRWISYTVVTLQQLFYISLMASSWLSHAVVTASERIAGRMKSTRRRRDVSLVW